MDVNVNQVTNKCANYSVLTLLVCNTIMSMPRFSSLDRSEIITTIYEAMKSKAKKYAK